MRSHALVNEHQVGIEELARRALGVGACHVLLDGVHGLVVVAQQDAVLGGDVVVEGWLRYAAGVADVLYLHGVVAVLVEELERGSLNCLAVHVPSRGARWEVPRHRA